MRCAIHHLFSRSFFWFFSSCDQINFLKVRRSVFILRFPHSFVHVDFNLCFCETKKNYLEFQHLLSHSHSLSVALCLPLYLCSSSRLFPFLSLSLALSLACSFVRIVKQIKCQLNFADRIPRLHHRHPSAHLFSFAFHKRKFSISRTLYNFTARHRSVESTLSIFFSDAIHWIGKVDGMTTWHLMIGGEMNWSARSRANDTNEQVRKKQNMCEHIFAPQHHCKHQMRMHCQWHRHKYPHIHTHTSFSLLIQHRMLITSNEI